MVYEVGFICMRSGSGPFERLMGGQQGSRIVKPEFGHTFILRLRMAFITGNSQAVALDQFAQSWNARADRSMDIFPVVVKNSWSVSPTFLVMQ